MKSLLVGLTMLGLALPYAPSALAAEDWVEVASNDVGDRFLVDRNSIQSQGGFLWYWEYRDFQEPNNAFVGVELEQPVYGVMIYRSVDCASGVSRLRRMVVHTRGREVIHRAVYEDNGRLSQPYSGSSAETVLNYVCEREETAPTASSP